MNKEFQYTGSGVSLAGILGVVFITLKLTNVIDWSWTWVLAPFWIPWAIFFMVLFIAIFAAFVIAAISKD